MKHFIRAALALGAGVLALAFSTAAVAAMNPRLDIGTSTQKGASNLALGVRLGQSDDWLGRLQVYIPSAYTLKVPAAGAQVGSIQVQAVPTQVDPSQTFKLAGTVKAVAANDPSLAAQAGACDAQTHVAAWTATMLSSDDSWTIPIFVDQTTGTETQFGSYKLVACLGPREAGATNTYGNKFVAMSLMLSGFGLPTKPGDYKWHSLFTPFTGATGSVLDQTATVEAQSTVRIANAVLTIASHKSGKHVVLTGKLVAGGEAMDGIPVSIKHGASSATLVAMGSVKTGAKGTWTLRAAAKGPAYFQAGATIGKSDLGAGQCTAAFGYPCLDATIGATGVVSRLIHVR